MIYFATRYFGGGINKSPFNSAKINSRYNVWFTEKASGSVNSSGYADIYVSKFPSVGGTAYISGIVNPWMYLFPVVGGNVISSGHSAQAYAQLQVVGGNINWSEFITNGYYGHLEIPTGYAEVSGTASARPVIQVQIMHTERTAVVPGFDTELFIENLFTEANVVKTEDRQIDVPSIVDFYI